MNSINQNRNRALGIAALAAILVGASAPVGHAQTYNNQVDLSPGTVIPVKLNTELSSNQSQTGDAFTANVDDSKEAYNSIMHGATVTGVVRHVTAQSGDTAGTLDLAFTRLHFVRWPHDFHHRLPCQSGYQKPFDALRRRSGREEYQQDNRLTYAGYGAGAGLLVSLLTGSKQIKIEDILLGGLAGYGAGSILKGPQQVHDVDLTPGTEIGVRLDSRTRYFPQGA